MAEETEDMIAIMSVDEDGDSTIETIGRNELIQRLEEGHYGESPRFLTRAELVRAGQGGGSDLNELGGGFHLIFSIEKGGLIEPKCEVKAVEWKL